jgi:hypothetical protein
MAYILSLPLLLLALNACWLTKAAQPASLTLPSAVVMCQPFTYAYSSSDDHRFNMQVVDSGEL